MNRHFYLSIFLALLVLSTQLYANSLPSVVASITIESKSGLIPNPNAVALNRPYLEEMWYNATEFDLYIYNDNDGGVTEIY